MGLHRVGHDWSDLAAAANCSTPGFPVLHYIPEFAQTHVHWVSDAVQPSLSLSPPSPPALSLSQNQSLFQWVGSLHQVTTVLELQLQYQSFQMNIQGWFPLTGLISLPSKGLSRVFSSTRVGRHESFSAQPSLWSSSHLYMTTGKTIVLTIWTFVSKLMSVLFITLSRFVIASLPRIKHLWISWPQSLSTVILEPKKIESISASTFSPSVCLEMMGPDAMIFIFWMLNFKPAFLLFYFTNIKRLFSSLHFLPLEWYHLHIWGCWYISRQNRLVWYSHLFKNFSVCCDSHKCFGIVNKAKVGVFLELSRFFDDPEDNGNLISGSSSFTKSRLNIWKFTVHALLKPGLENFEHYFASVWDECNCTVVWTSYLTGFEIAQLEFHHLH